MVACSVAVNGSAEVKDIDNLALLFEVVNEK